MLVMAGAMALGGGLYTVVVDSLTLRAVDVDVDSVTIGSAAPAVADVRTTAQVIIIFVNAFTVISWGLNHNWNPKP
jgi:hypothetical protein